MTEGLYVRCALGVARPERGSVGDETGIDEGADGDGRGRRWPRRGRSRLGDRPVTGADGDRERDADRGIARPGRPAGCRSDAIQLRTAGGRQGRGCVCRAARARCLGGSARQDALAGGRHRPRLVARPRIDSGQRDAGRRRQPTRRDVQRQGGAILRRRLRRADRGQRPCEARLHHLHLQRGLQWRHRGEARRDGAPPRPALPWTLHAAQEGRRAVREPRRRRALRARLSAEEGHHDGRVPQGPVRRQRARVRQGPQRRVRTWRRTFSAAATRATTGS